MSAATLYRVLAPRGVGEGGQRVAVFPDAAGDLQIRAAAAGAPLSVFLEEGGSEALAGPLLRAFTPERELGGSPAASLAALAWLQAGGGLGDVAEVRMAKDTVPAQLCGGEWLLLQGSPVVREAGADVLAEARALPGLEGVEAAHLAGTERPALVLALPGLAALDAFAAGPGGLAAFGAATGTAELVLYTLAAPAEGPQRRADVSFRAFGGPRGQEEAANVSLCAGLVAVLGARGRWPQEAQTLRAAQRCPGQPALLTAQFSAPGEAVWVGGRAERLEGGRLD